MNDSRRDLARRHAIAVMNKIRDNIDTNATTVNRTRAAEAAGVSPSSFYRWLASPPEKIDVAALASLADWLHDEYGHADFAALWRETRPDVAATEPLAESVLEIRSAAE